MKIILYCFEIIYTISVKIELSDNISLTNIIHLQWKHVDVCSANNKWWCMNLVCPIRSQVRLLCL